MNGTTTESKSATATIQDGPWLVWSNEHEAWWGPNHCGYFMDIDAAGRYSRKEAVGICHLACRGRCKPVTTAPPEVMVPSPEMLAAPAPDPEPTVGAIREALNEAVTELTHEARWDGGGSPENHAAMAEILVRRALALLGATP